MINLRIAICGDSYSAVNSSSTCYPEIVESYSWIHDLQERYSVECYAESGRSNFDILKQVKRCDEPIIITNVTSLHRTTFSMTLRSVDISKQDLVNYNLKYARLIAQLSDICWTPFVGYETIPEIQYLPFERENEMYNERLGSELTKHHLTRQGNEMLRDEMLYQIEKIRRTNVKATKR